MNTTIDQSKFLPNASPDDYYFIIYPDVPLRCTHGFVASIKNFSNDQINIEVEIDTPWMIEKRQLSCVFLADPDDYCHSQLVMTAKYFDEVRKNEFMQFVIWHETGHFHTMHYFQTEFNERNSSQASREKYFDRGEIMPEEKVADLFGVYYTSKETAIQFLNYSIKRRRENKFEDADINTRAVRELTRRKRFINEFDCTDENIRNEICRLCGVEDFESL